MFENYASFNVQTAGAQIFGRRGGSGPPLLLLHGFPQTHVMWRHVADALAERFTIFATDLRGYGDSSAPPSCPEHWPYSKRVMAQDMVEVMEAFGYRRFFVAGHDRGGRCAYRMALDYPDRVAALSALDLVPTYEAFARAGMEFALGFWPWTLLAQDAPFPERLIAADPELICNYPLDSWSADPDVFPAEVRSAYLKQFTDPERAHAICEEYRAAATIDYLQDKRDRERAKKIRCPVQALWAKRGAVHAWYDPLAIWRDWADDVTGEPIDCGHFLPEEAPQAVAEAMAAFFTGAAQ